MSFNDSYPTDTSSIAITTYSILRKTQVQSQCSTVESITPGFHQKGNNVPQLPPPTPISSLQRSSVETVSYFEYYSKATVCIATSFGECGLYTPALDKLWYFYSYIYTNTILITLLFIVVVAMLMPTTALPTTSASIISPSPHLSRTRSFTMTNFTTITQYSFEFGPHPTCCTFGIALNNSYAEDFEHAVVATFFTDAAMTTVVFNVIPVIRAAIVDIVLFSSTVNRTVAVPIINHMPLFGHCGNPQQKFAIRSLATFTTSLEAVVAATQTILVIKLNSASVGLDGDNYDVMDFDWISTTGPVRHINSATHSGVVGAAAAAAAVSAAAVLSPAAAAVAAAAATAANQALLAQQAAATAAVAATSPATFDIQNFPPVVKARHLNHLDPSYLMTKNDMIPYPMPTGGVCLSFSHLDPPMGTGVTTQPDSHRVIACDGQFFALADQGTAGLKLFFASVPTCIGTSPEAI